MIPIFKSNTPINQERISRIEEVVTRLARRAKTKATTLITPYPISSTLIGEDIKGTILRYMFPCEGTITKGLIRLGKKPKDGVAIEIKISSDAHVESKGFVITQRQLLVKPSLKVYSGDRLSISIKSLNQDDKVTETWISFLWAPTMKDIEVKSYLISELENAMIEEFGPKLLEKK